MPSATRLELVNAYIADIQCAGTESAKKERLIVLLKDLFPGAEADALIRDFVAGAERGVANIERATGLGRGQADTQYRSIIIEFEKDLSRTGEHARDQLREYLSGNWNSNVRFEFTLIASDCLTWKVYAPEFESLIELESLRADDIALEETDGICLAPCADREKALEQADAFYFFLDRHLFRQQPLPATLDAVRKAFGHTSSVYRAAMRILHALYRQQEDSPAMQTAYKEWHRFLSIAYGRFTASERAFLTQSYLSVLAKILAFAVIERRDFLDQAAIRAILDGTAFQRHNIENFTDDDFFRWTAEPEHFEALKPLFYAIADELAHFDFSAVHEDILKGVYQELVDEDTRHSLGEFYTPDWLCAKIVGELALTVGEKILDPACGSGSFLKAAANELCRLNPEITAQELNDSLYGIDIHPLSVQIAKATLLTSLGNRLHAAPRRLSLHIYLANTLLLPNEDVGMRLLGKQYKLRIANKEVTLAAEVFDDEKEYDKLVFYCDLLVQSDAPRGQQKQRRDIESFFRLKLNKKESYLLEGAWRIYSALYAAKVEDRDGIWAYVLQNSLRPFFLREKFDVIVGNPPWLTFADVENGEYQEDLRRLANLYALKPDTANMPHLELAALFLAHACNYFMKPGGRLAMVMPRAFFSGGQHEPTRKGKTRKVALTQLWNLQDVAPLFKVPSCVLFARRKTRDGAPGPGELPGRALSGRLPGHNIPLPAATPHIREASGLFHLSHLGEATAWTFGERIALSGVNPYKSQFRQGATIVPRVFYFVDIDQPYAGDLQHRLLLFKSSQAALKEAKAPWKMTLRGTANTRFLFRTALANNILPFTLNGTRLVLLPLEIKKGQSNLLTPEQLEKSGELETAQWFRQAEKHWEKNKTERAKKMTMLNRLDFQHGILSQIIVAQYLVLYCATGSNACAAVLTREAANELLFVADHITYTFFATTRKEADYLCAFLNAPHVNELIKPFQTQGQQGERHIHKRILDVPLPLFDADNPDHLRLAELGAQAAAKAEVFVAGRNLGEDGGTLPPNQLGRLRGEIRAHLGQELQAIDAALRRIWKMA